MGLQMKSERITVLGSPEFKAFLTQEAVNEGISVSELVRRRCEQAPSEDERLLAALSVELTQAVALAKDALAEGLLAVQEVLGTADNQEKAA